MATNTARNKIRMRLAMSVVVSFAPGPEGEAAVLEAASQSTRLGRPLIVVCTVPSDEARARAHEVASQHTGGRVIELNDGEDAVEVIVDAIEREKAGLLVIGLRRRTPVGKLILGSSAQRLLLDAPCPVMAVKPE